ncbi:hypothetical protein ACH5RR_018401 [Cinchona calisaya]|uniref:Uncharacterized protein n=1 Tax=Cinchona calisaya TaxID=153742 RepID=A0ABD2ZP64_9GENT
MGAPSSLPDKLSCRDDTFLSGRSEKTSLHHETDRICRRHPKDLHKAGEKNPASFSNFSSGGLKSPFIEGLSYSGIAPSFLGPLISRIAAYITS